MKFKKIIGLLLSTAMLAGSVVIPTVAVEQSDPMVVNEQTESEPLPVLTEFSEVLDFETGTEGFAGSEFFTTEISSDNVQVGENALKIVTQSARSYTFETEITLDEMQTGKKVGFWLYDDGDANRQLIFRFSDGTVNKDESGYTSYTSEMYFGIHRDNVGRKYAAYARRTNPTNGLDYQPGADQLAYRTTSKGWHYFEMDMTTPGEVNYYVDGVLRDTMEIFDGELADFKTLTIMDTWGSGATNIPKTGIYYIDDITISSPTPVATNPVFDDATDTFTWDWAPGYDEVGLYEYSLDAGETWTTCQSRPIYVGNENYQPGDIRVRVISDSDEYVFPHVENEEEGVYVENISLTMERDEDLTDIVNYGSAAPTVTISDNFSRSGLNSMEILPASSSNYQIHYLTDELVADKVVTVWFYDEMLMGSNDTRRLGLVSVEDFITDSNKNSSAVMGLDSQHDGGMHYMARPNWGGGVTSTADRFEGWHSYQWDFSDGENCSIYIDDVFIAKYSSDGFNRIQFINTWTSATNAIYYDDLTITDTREEVPMYAAAPTAPVNDDTADTFGFTMVDGYSELSNYEYSTDRGQTFTEVTANPIVVGDFSYDKGDIIVRVKAEATGESAGIVLRNDVEFKSTYADNIGEIAETLDFVKGFFELDYSDATAWANFETAVAYAETIDKESTKDESDKAIADLDTAVEALKACFNPPSNARYDFEENEADLNPFTAVEGVLTKGESDSLLGKTIDEPLDEKKGALISTSLEDGMHLSEAVYSFPVSLDDYIIELGWQTTAKPTGVTEFFLMDEEELNGFGLRCSSSVKNYQLVTIINGKETIVDTEIKYDGSHFHAMRWDFANPETGVEFTIDTREIVTTSIEEDAEGLRTYIIEGLNHADVESFDKIVVRSTSSKEDSVKFDRLLMMKKNPAASVTIADDVAEVGYFETYNLVDILLDIVGEDPSYDSTDTMSYSVDKEGIVNITSDGLVEPMEFGEVNVTVTATSGASDTVLIKAIDAQAESVFITDAPQIDIVAMGAPGQDTNNSMPVEKISSVDLNIGESKVLNAVITPDNTTERTADWTSSNENVAYVKDGLVTAVNEGTAVITAITRDTGKTDTVEVYVGPDKHVYGREIFVATDGSDTTGDGTMENPFATIEMARDEIAKSELPDGGVVVYFREGTYQISNTIEFDADDSGEADKPIKYTAYEDETVTFSGGISIGMDEMELVTEDHIGYSRLHADAVGEVYAVEVTSKGITQKPLQILGHSASVLVPRELFDHMNFSDAYYMLSFNDDPMTLARFPNETDDIDGKGAGYIDFDVIDKGRSPRNWATDAVVNGWGYAYEPGFEDEVFTITAHELSAAKLATWSAALDYDADKSNYGGQGAWMNGYWGTNYSTQTLPLASISGNQITSGMVSAYELLRNTDGHEMFYVYNLLEELDIEGEWYIDQITDRDEFQLYFYPPEGTDMTSSEETISIPLLEEVAIHIEKASYITFDGIDMKNMNAGVFNVYGGSYNVLENSDIMNIGGRLSAIGNSSDGTVGTFNGLNMCTIKNIDGGVSLSGGNNVTLERGYNYIQNSTITNFSMQNRSYNPGINVGGTGNRASNVILTDAPHSAIMFSGPEQTLEFIEIYDVVTEADDQSQVYTGRDTLNRGTIIRNSYFHDLSPAGYDKNAGVYLDDSKGGVALWDNVFENLTVGLKSGGRNVDSIGNAFINCQTGMLVDTSNLYTTGSIWLHGYGLISDSGDFTPTTIDWQDQDGPYGRFDMLWATYEDSPLESKYRKAIDNVFINVERDDVAEARSHYFGDNIAIYYWEQLPYLSLAIDHMYDGTFTKNNNGQDYPELGLDHNPRVFDEAYDTRYSVTTQVGTGMGTTAGDIRDCVIEGMTRKVTAEADSGYEFVNWTDASGKVVSENPILFFDVYSNNTFTANFAEESNEVSGDANADGSTNNKDIFLMLQYIANSQSVVIDVLAVDVNGNGVVDNTDVLQLFALVSQTF